MEGPELLRIIDAIHREKDIDPEVLFEGIESALLTAARRQYGTTGEILVKIDRETGEFRAYEETPDGDVTIPLDLGRIAAQTAKQVIIQRIREAERDAIFDEFADRLHTIVTGSVQRFEGGTIIADVNRSEAILPQAVSTSNRRSSQKPPREPLRTSSISTPRPLAPTRMDSATVSAPSAQAVASLGTKIFTAISLQPPARRSVHRTIPGIRARKFRR